MKRRKERLKYELQLNKIHKEIDKISKIPRYDELRDKLS